MKHAFLSTAILLLALYGQASAAQDWYLFDSKSVDQDQVIQSIQPTWVMTEAQSGLRWIGYVDLQKAQDISLGLVTRQQWIGIGLLQQWAPGLYSQWALEQGLTAHAAVTPKWQMVFQF